MPLPPITPHAHSPTVASASPAQGREQPAEVGQNARAAPSHAALEPARVRGGPSNDVTTPRVPAPSAPQPLASSTPAPSSVSLEWRLFWPRPRHGGQMPAADLLDRVEKTVRARSTELSTRAQAEGRLADSNRLALDAATSTRSDARSDCYLNIMDAENGVKMRPVGDRTKLELKSRLRVDSLVGDPRTGERIPVETWDKTLSAPVCGRRVDPDAIASRIVRHAEELRRAGADASAACANRAARRFALGTCPPQNSLAKDRHGVQIAAKNGAAVYRMEVTDFELARQPWRSVAFEGRSPGVTAKDVAVFAAAIRAMLKQEIPEMADEIEGGYPAFLQRTQAVTLSTLKCTVQICRDDAGGSVLITAHPEAGVNPTPARTLLQLRLPDPENAERLVHLVRDRRQPGEKTGLPSHTRSAPGAQGGQHVEIERKFVIDPAAFQRLREQGSLPEPSHIRQGFLRSDPDCVVRVRLRGDDGSLTFKGLTVGATRDELEYPIPATVARDLLATVAEPGVIEKNRYVIQDPTDETLVWELDEFQGQNQGLIVAEVELPSEGYGFAMPEWVTRDADVTGDPRYYNSSLSRHPFAAW